MKINFNSHIYNISMLSPVIDNQQNQSKTFSFSTDIVSFGANSYYKNAKNIYSAINNSKRICILAHKDIDADAISSGILFLKLLKRKYSNKDIQFVINQDIPKFCSNIPYTSEITKYKDLTNKNFDTVVVLDCDDTRVDCYDIFEKANTRINIDHHRNSINNSKFSQQLRILNPEAVSTTQVIYDNLLTPFGIKPNDQLIECIMTGILADSGNLKNISNNLDFSITMDLLEQQSKVPLKSVIRNINNKFTTSKQRSKELEYLFEDTVTGANVNKHETSKGRKINYIVIDKKLLDKYQIKDNEADIKETINSIISMHKSKCDVAVALWEKESGEIRLSLRSKNIDVLGVAEKFGGGGHLYAAGAPISGTLDEAIEKALKIIDSEL